MIPTTEVNGWKASAVALVALALLLPGCGPAPDPADPRDLRPGNSSAPGTGLAPSRTTASGAIPVSAGAAPGSSNALPTEVQLAAITNQFAAFQEAQAGQIERLLLRIEQLEQEDAAQSQSAQETRKAYDQEIQARENRALRLAAQIQELEHKVASLEFGRLLPEISVAADDAPTPYEIDQKIRVIERKNELAAEATEARAKEAPRFTAGAEGFSLRSADTNFVLKLRGLVQLDSRTFFDDNPLSEGNDGFVLRRVRPILEGTVFRDFDFNLTPDFAGSSPQIFDAWLNYRYRPELQLRAGKFKGPVGFENLQSDSTLPFNERSMVSALVPVRNVGVQLWGDIGDGVLGYAAGVFNSAGDSRNPGASDFNDDKEFAARLSLQPFKHGGIPALQGLGIGVGGSYSQVSSNALALPGTTGGTLPGYTTSGQQQFFAYNPTVGPVVGDGSHRRLSPQVSYLHGPFGLLGEYALSRQEILNSSTFRQADLTHTAWQVSAQWVLTGEPASFTGIVPKRPFDPRSGGWGAWQLVGRYGQLDIDDDVFQGFANPANSGSSATSWSVGINWWLNRNVRFLLSYAYTGFEGGGGHNPLDATTLVPPATVTQQPESMIFTRLQLSF